MEFPIPVGDEGGEAVRHGSPMDGAGTARASLRWPVTPREWEAAGK